MRMRPEERKRQFAAWQGTAKKGDVFSGSYKGKPRFGFVESFGGSVSGKGPWVKIRLPKPDSRGRLFITMSVMDESFKLSDEL